MKERILFLILAISIALFFINDYALKYNLYFSVSWIDTVTHSLGGAIIAGIFFYVFDLMKRFVKTSVKTPDKISGTVVVGSVFLVGIIWELFELKAGLTVFTDRGYMLDTLGDLFFDIFGAYIFYFFLTSTSNEQQ